MFEEDNSFLMRPAGLQFMQRYPPFFFFNIKWWIELARGVAVTVGALKTLSRGCTAQTTIFSVPLSCT